MSCTCINEHSAALYSETAFSNFIIALSHITISIFVRLTGNWQSKCAKHNVRDLLCHYEKCNNIPPQSRKLMGSTELNHLGWVFFSMDDELI